MSGNIWDDPALTGAVGEAIADDLREMVRAYEAAADRSQQTDIGPSEVGKPCTRCLARHVLGCRVAREFDDPWCRIIGTATHSWLAEAAVHANVAQDRARWLAEMRVYPEAQVLPRGGNADLYDTDRRAVIDHKVVSADRLKQFRLNGPGRTYRYQAHLYGLGFVNAGKAVEHVAVAFWNRGGRLRDLYVWTEPYDEQIAQEALTRFRTIRDQALAIGPAILPLLPADPDCWDCEGKDVSADELAVISTTQPNPANAA